MQKVSEGEGKVLSQSCDVTNQLHGECRRHGKSKSRANPKYSRKISFAFSKTAWFGFTFFYFLGLRGHGPVASPLGKLVISCNSYSKIEFGLDDVGIIRNVNLIITIKFTKPC